MGRTNEIKNLEGLLKQFLGDRITIVESSTKSLTAAGDNYGSQMLALQVTFEYNGSEKPETLHLVSKMCPPNEYLKEVFDIAFTFKKEIAVYSEIFPTLREFQQQQGSNNIIEFFPECYGTRLSLDPNSNEVDDDAVLLLENLKIPGYDVVDRMKGFDLQTTELLLKDLAVLHAVPIALKLLEPDVFKKKVLAHLRRTPVFDNLSENGLQACIDFVTNTAKLDSKCVPLIPKVIKSMRAGFREITNPAPQREPFATMTHNDFWVNNTMLKFENNNPVKNKMLDFQIVDYGSPADDIVFLLFSSVQTPVIELYYDNLIKLYYDTFISTLKDLKCDTAPFTFKLLLEEINICAKSTQFFHTMMMLRHILAIKGKVKELSEITEEDLVSHSEVSPQCKQKVIETILYFAKMKWI